jgi:hypothetical protein
MAAAFICRHSTENVYKDTYTGTSIVILAKHGLELPDDGFINRNMLEQLL